MTSERYERALAFLDEAVTVLDECSILTDLGPSECARPTRASVASADREHDRRSDRQGFRPW